MIQIQEEPNAVTVKLESFEVAVAAQVGFRRALFADLRGSKPAFPEKYPGQLWYGHIAGACAEFAVAKHLGAFWDGSVDVSDREDIPGWDVDVRFSPSFPKVKPRDTLRIVAVTGKATQIDTYTIIGWLDASEAKREEWASPDAPKCYFPPSHAWRDINTLRKR